MIVSYKKFKAYLSGEFIKSSNTVVACRGENGLAQGDCLQVVPSRNIGLTARFEGVQQAPHRPGEGVGKPRLPPARAMPSALVANGGIINRAGNAVGPAGPADCAQGEPFGPLESPTNADLRPGPFSGRPGPDIVPGRRSAPRRTPGCRG